MTHSFRHNRRFEAMRVQNEHLSWSKKCLSGDAPYPPRSGGGRVDNLLVARNAIFSRHIILGDSILGSAIQLVAVPFC